MTIAFFELRLSVTQNYIFERELASLVALQVVSSKEGEEGEEEENFLTSFNKPRLEA